MANNEFPRSLVPREPLDEKDRQALVLALDIICKESRGRAKQINAKLQDEKWEEVAAFASWCCQRNSLQLKAWHRPPCALYDNMDAILAYGDDGLRGSYAAARLLQQMLNNGVSRWHPDPAGALAQARNKENK